MFLLLMAANEFVRPWVYVNSRSSGKRLAGYYILGFRPAIKSPTEMKSLFGIVDSNTEIGYDVKYDYLRLNLQRGVIVSLFFAALLLFCFRNPVIKWLTAVPLISFLYFLYFFLLVATR